MDFSQMLDSAWNSGHRHILVSGESGSGKTFFLRNIACELRKSTPIYIDLAPANGDNYISKKILKEYCGYTEFQDTESVLENKLINVLDGQAGNAAKYDLLLDGIDEISPQYSGNLYKELEILAGCSGVQIVLAAKSMKTVRDAFYFEKLDSFSEYPVQLLSDEAVRQALKKRNVDDNGISDSVKTMLRKPLFLHSFLELAENGTDVSKVGSAFDLYSAIIEHDIRIVGKQDGKRGIAEYALEKLLPALAARLDSVAFDYDTLKSSLLNAFWDTAYANPGMDGISTDQLARFKRNNDLAESQSFTESVYDSIAKQYLDAIFLDRQYLVRIDDGHYRFSHSTWFQFFQIKHIVNEINKTDSRSVPNTVPDEQVERYFGNKKKTEEKIATEGVEQLADQAFQSVITGKKKKSKWSKIIKSILCFSAVAALICIMFLVVSNRSGTPMYHFTLTPTEMTLTQYKEAAATIEDRVRILADGEKYKFKADGEKIEISLPQSVFHAIDPIDTMKNYVSREQLFYLIDLNSVDMLTRNVDSILLKQQDIEKVSSDYGVIPGVDIEKYEAGSGGYCYISITMTPDWTENNRERIESWEESRVAANIGYDSWSYADITVLSDDFRTIFIPFEDSFPKSFINVIEYNLLHAPLAGGFYIELETEPVWEKINETSHPGMLQRNESDLRKNTVTLYYDTPIEDITTGSWIDLLTVLKARMDSLGEPYAVGYRPQGDTYQILIKTLPDHFNTEIVHLLTVRYPNIAASITGGLHRYDEADYSRLDVDLIESDNRDVLLGIDSVIYSDHKSLVEFIAECAEDGVTELLLCIDGIPVLSTPVDSVTQEGKVLFRNIFWNGMQFSEETKWLAEFVKEMIVGPELPCHISCYGVTTDEAKNVRIEDGVEVGNDERLIRIWGAIRSIDPYMTTSGVSSNRPSQYNVFLHIPVDEDLPKTAVEKIKAMYNAVDFINSGFQTVIFFLGEEDDDQQERARVCFRKDYSENNVDIDIIFKNGRYEKYCEQFKSIIQQDDSFQQFDVSWNGEEIVFNGTDTNLSNLKVASDSAAPTLSDLEAMAESHDTKTRSNTGSKLELPTEEEMLETPFRAHIDNGKGIGSIYIMPKPKGGYGYLGTVETDTEVWIVAETPFYYFFVTDDGWMGWNGKSFFS